MGTEKQTIIEVNGKRYDARTGQLVSGHVSPAKTPVKTAVRPVSDIARTTPAATAHNRRSPQRSQTLMRGAVKKPQPKPTAKASKSRVGSDITAARPTSKQSLALPAHNEAERIARAKAVKQSKLVKKFGDFVNRPLGTQAVTQRVAPLAVQPAPVTLSHHQPALIPQKKAAQSIIDKGLKAAQSHNETFKPHKATRRRGRGKLARIGAASLAFLLLGGFIAYQNAPNIAMRYAATRAGVSASLPSYQPSGFALNSHIQYNPGQITVKFASNADERNFTITQRESNWNSDTLMNNYVATTEEPVQTYEDKGRTIYLYGDSNATWVNGGVWYDIKGNSQLTSDQLIRIATSM